MDWNQAKKLQDELETRKRLESGRSKKALSPKFRGASKWAKNEGMFTNVKER